MLFSTIGKDRFDGQLKKVSLTCETKAKAINNNLWAFFAVLLGAATGTIITIVWIIYMAVVLRIKPFTRRMIVAKYRYYLISAVP